MNEKLEKVKELFTDEAFVKELLGTESAETVQQKLAAKGLDMTIGEIELMGEMLEDFQRNGTVSDDTLQRLLSGGELTEDDLTAAAGGNPELGMTIIKSGEQIKEICVDLFGDSGEMTAAGKEFLDNVAGRISGASVAGSAGGSTVAAAIACVVVVGGVIAAGYGYVTRRW